MALAARRYARAGRAALVVAMVSGGAGLLVGAGSAGAASAKHPPTLTAATPATGIAGTRVTLAGSHLSTEIAVRFGKNKATSVTVKRADKLIAVAPPGKGTVEVRVRTPTGISNSEPFIYDAPVVTSLSHTRGVAGTVVTVRGTGFSSTAVVRFGGEAVPGATVKNATTIIFAVPAIGTARKKVNVVVQTAAGTSAPLTFIFLALEVATTSLPGAVTTRAYQGATLQAKGGTGTVTWSVGPGFPRGLSLSAATGTISGRVGTAGTYTFSVTATDAVGASATKALSVTVTEGPFQITTTSLPTASLDTPYTGYLSDNSIVYFPPTFPLHVTTWSATGLPSGLTITSSWGTISGTPSGAGTFPVTVTVTLLGQYFATKTFTFVVQGFHITTTRIAAFTSTIWGHTGPTTLVAVTGTGTLHWSATGLPAGLHLTPTTGTITGAPGRGGATVGTHTFTATVTDGGGATTSQEVTVQIVQGSFIITTSGVGAAYLDTPYDAYLYAYGQPLYFPPSYGLTSWSAAGLPPGLAITSVYGTIFGTPTATGTSRVTVTDVNAGTFFEVVAFTLSVLAFHITTSTLAGWTTELPAPTTSGATQLAATGGTGHYTWSVGTGFPPGLTLTSSGAIEPTLVTGLTGAPVAAGTYHFTVTATDGEGGTSKKGFTLVVTQGSFAIGAVASQKADEATPYALYLSDNFPPTTVGPTLWFATGLPSGLTITEIYGTISGTPTATGTSTVTVRATFGVGALWASRQFTVTVYPALSITTASLPNGTKYLPYGPQPLAATGGTGSYSWSASGLPAGIHITSSTGTISGTPTAPTGAFTYTKVHITVHDGADGSVTKSFTLLVYANIAMLSVDPGAAGTKDAATVTGSFPSAKVVWNGAVLPGSATASATTTTVTFFVPPGSGTVTVDVLLQGATASTSTRFVYTATPGLFQTTPAPSGKTGARVTFHGSGFVAGDTVTFDASAPPTETSLTSARHTPVSTIITQAASITSSTALTVTVPRAIGGTVHVYVNPPSGPASNAIAFTFAYAPHIVAIAPSTIIGITGKFEMSSSTLYGTGFTDSMKVKWGTCTLKQVPGVVSLGDFGAVNAPNTTVFGGSGWLTVVPPTNARYGACDVQPFETLTITNRFGSETISFETLFTLLWTRTTDPAQSTRSNTTGLGSLL